VRRRLNAAEQTLAEPQAERKRAKTAFDAASDRFTEIEHALDVARGGADWRAPL
jgi:hypothetical protein